MAYAVADVEDIPYTWGTFKFVRQRLGATAFGFAQIDFPPGKVGSEHDETESGHQEAYIVVSGRAAFVIGDQRFEAGPGSVVSAPNPADVRSYSALEPSTRIVCVGAAPGEPHPYGEWISEDATEA